MGSEKLETIRKDYSSTSFIVIFCSCIFSCKLMMLDEIIPKSFLVLKSYNIPLKKTISGEYCGGLKTVTDTLLFSPSRDDDDFSSLELGL